MKPRAHNNNNNKNNNNLSSLLKKLLFTKSLWCAQNPNKCSFAVPVRSDYLRFQKRIPVKSPKRPMQSPSSCSQKSKVRLEIPASRCEACLCGGKCYCNTVLLTQKSVVFPIVRVHPPPRSQLAPFTQDRSRLCFPPRCVPTLIQM